MENSYLCTSGLRSEIIEERTVVSTEMNFCDGVTRRERRG
jgi:hypothetical protein